MKCPSHFENTPQLGCLSEPRHVRVFDEGHFQIPDHESKVQLAGRGPKSSESPIFSGSTQILGLPELPRRSARSEKIFCTPSPRSPEMRRRSQIPCISTTFGPPRQLQARRSSLDYIPDRRPRSRFSIGGSFRPCCVDLPSFSFLGGHRPVFSFLRRGPEFANLEGGGGGGGCSFLIFGGPSPSFF